MTGAGKVFVAMKKQEYSLSLANEIFSNAINAGDLTRLSEALSKGADIHHKDSGGWTWVMQAATANRPVIMEALLSAGADVDARSGR